jgi:murein L,D-transpeptidase YcbB/YkuD
MRNNLSLFHGLKLLFLSAVFFLLSCNEHVDVSSHEIVEKPEQINERAEDVIKGTLQELLSSHSELQDSFKIKNPEIVQALYDKNSFQPIWSEKGLFTKNGDSLLSLIGQSKIYGLFPDDYYYTRIGQLKNQLITDTSAAKKLDASLWALSDMLMTSAFVQVIKDLKAGRILPDSVLAKDTSLSTRFFLSQLKDYPQISNDSFARRLEPANTDYKKIKTALKPFLDSADFTAYTLVSTTDSSQIPRLLYQRLHEEDSTLVENNSPDSMDVAAAIKKYQKRKKWKVDGKITSNLIDRLNSTDREKFIRIAITLDRYKQLQPLPEKYIWVNLPSYFLQLRDSDTVVLKSKIVVGKPITRTPILTSSISDMITYPKWTIPESIVKKEILPGLQKDPAYTANKGYSLVDKDGNEIDPYQVNWAKYKEYIPYKVVQGSGDDNALGVLKFNFPNKYSVYLHDTNQRYLFAKSSRALSHGCVRVQAWDSLARYILRNDSLHASNYVPIDSLNSWLETKQKKYIPVRKQIPLFIRYFTCDVNDKGKLVFYEDIYGEDRKIRETVFASK